ncbi:tetratricopeptide repeat protein 25-like [Temnothorax curvispinosus]|uniref:Tetratricopeptide repeat protein 25-like n=1 Tax=Temnothorax curvispinosus TaxID=300111 RepID=A0A6J1RD64_9HYME|nr:tetratricopeptide repeat protein 25-like [Temnothorax curvispinosus]
MSALKKEEAPEVFREAILYREWGYRLASLGKYLLAIDYFEKASKSAEAEDLRTLIGLYRALIKCTKYFAAEKLSEKCMKIDPGHYKVRQMRMEALFQIGEFGHSLVHAYEGMRRHGVTFEHGAYQANETIEDCIGRNTSPVALLLLYPWIRRLWEHRELLIGKFEEKENELEGVAKDEVRFKVNDPEVQRQARMKRLQRVIAKMNMGYLTIDRDFLEEIVNRPEIVASSSKRSITELLALASTCYRNATYLQDLLRMRRPFYVTLFRRRKISKRRRMMMEQERKLRRNIVVVKADFLLRLLQAARINKDYPAFFKLVDHIKDSFDAYSDKMFPLKQKCLDALYKTVARVYLDTRNLTCLNEEMKMRYLKHHLGIRVATLPRDSDIAWMPTVNPKKTLKIFRRRLVMASAPLELAWLHHEFCKFLIDIRRFDLARFYAKKGHDMAQKANCDQWVLNIDHLMLRLEIYQNNRNEMRDVAIQALAHARKLNIDCLIDFYERAMRVVDELDMERSGDFDDIAARQQLILELMPKEMKGEVDFLWRRMDVVPAERRLSVMPGCKPIDRKFKMPSTRRTILPNPPKDPKRDARIALLKQHAPPHRRPGFVNFQEFE